MPHRVPSIALALAFLGCNQESPQDAGTATATDAECGNGVVEPGEACDDGNTANDDGCTDLCQLRVCGDGIVQSGEDCDAADDPGCLDDCSWRPCGLGDKLFASDGDEDAEFGYSVAIDGDTVVVGAPKTDLDPEIEGSAGAAYVCERRGEQRWVQVAKLTPGEEIEKTQFGCDVAISGDTIVVGTRKGNLVHVFERSAGRWPELPSQTLAPSEVLGAAYFGVSVDVDGGVLIVGAYADDSAGAGAGSVFVFERDGDEWAETAKITASNAAQSAYFGSSVGVSGERLAVSTCRGVDYGLQDDPVYVYERDGPNWIETPLTTDDPWEAPRCKSVSIDGDTVVVGAPWDGDESTDRLRIFERSGETWELHEVHPSGVSAGDYAGLDVSVDGDVIVAGAPRKNDLGTDSGAAYLLRRTETGWSEPQLLYASDGEEFDEFGHSVAVSGATLVVGAREDDALGLVDVGSAYVFAVP